MTDDEWEHHKQKLLFAQVDRLLDGQSPVTHLADERQAEIVQKALLHFANERYKLLAYVVMPSHHHWLFLPDEDWAIKAVGGSRDAEGHDRTPREIISHSIQSYTATMCNRVRGVSGAYWQTETFDHWARDESEMLRIIDYIEQNPVKANLVDCPQKWRWSSARLRAATGVPPGQALYVG
jgi:type I restriction enzyme R subunit